MVSHWDRFAFLSSSPEVSVSASVTQGCVQAVNPAAAAAGWTGWLS